MPIVGPALDHDSLNCETIFQRGVHEFTKGTAFINFISVTNFRLHFITVECNILSVKKRYIQRFYRVKENKIPKFSFILELFWKPVVGNPPNFDRHQGLKIKSVSLRHIWKTGRAEQTDRVFPICLDDELNFVL